MVGSRGQTYSQQIHSRWTRIKHHCNLSVNLAQVSKMMEMEVLCASPGQVIHLQYVCIFLKGIHFWIPS